MNDLENSMVTGSGPWDAEDAPDLTPLETFQRLSPEDRLTVLEEALYRGDKGSWPIDRLCEMLAGGNTFSVADFLTFWQRIIEDAGDSFYAQEQVARRQAE